MKLPDYPPEYLVFGSLLAIGNRLQTLGDHFYEEITTKQWYVLAALELFAEPPSLGELSKAIGCSHQNTKQLVLKLREKGFAELFPDGADRRMLRIRKTEKCRGFEHKYQEKQTRFMRALFGGIPQGALGATLDTLQKLNENMSALQEGEVS